MTDSADDRQLHQRALRGTIVSVVGQLLTQILRFASNIVLTRFLPESAFGVGAMIFAVTTGLFLISDVGIGTSVVRSAREDKAFLDTAWTLSVVRGVVLAAIAALLGLPAAWLYDEPQLTWLLPLCSLMVLALASESTGFYVAQRRLLVGRLMALDIVAQLVALAVSIPVAIATGHVIALVLAALVSAIVKFCGSFVMIPSIRPSFAWDQTAVREIFSFGQWIFLSTLGSFVAMRWDVFSLGRLEGFALLGVYGIATQITSVPNQMSLQVTNAVLTPVLSAAFRDGAQALDGAIDTARRAYVPAAMLLFLGAATTAPAFFVWVYPAAFHEAGVMAQVLMFTVWLGFLQEASSRALVATGDGPGLALSNGVRVIVTMAATMVGFHLAGFWGFVGGNSVGAFVGVVVTGARLRRLGAHHVLAQDIAATGIFLVLLIVAGGAPIWLAPRIGIASHWLTLVSCVVCCGPLALVTKKRVKDARARVRP